MSNLAIIPARGGSKRIPKKNIKEFLGEPIINYPIKAAISSGCFDKVMVSTENEEIAAIAKSCGAEIPYMRSIETSNDFATTADVIREVITNYEKVGEKFTHICCLYPTAVFASVKIIQQANMIMLQERVSGVATIVPYQHPIEQALEIDNDQHISYREPQFSIIRTQDLTAYYHDAGQLYFLSVERFLEERKIFLTRMKAIILDPIRVQDIDTIGDWNLAELKYSQ